MCFRIINHKKSHITKGKGYICSNLKITDNEEIYITKVSQVKIHKRDLT